MEYTLVQTKELELTISSKEDKILEIIRNLGRDFDVDIIPHVDFPSPIETFRGYPVFINRIEITFKDKCEMHYFEYLFLGMIENIEKLELCLAINIDEVQ